MKNPLRFSAIAAVVAVMGTLAVPSPRSAEAAGHNAHARSGRVTAGLPANAVIGGSFIANARSFGSGTRIQLAPQSAYGEVGLPYDPALATARQIAQPLPDGGVQLVVKLSAPTAGPVTALAQIYSVNGERFVQFLLSDPAPGAGEGDAQASSYAAPARALRAQSAPVADSDGAAGDDAGQRRANAIERARQAHAAGSGAIDATDAAAAKKAARAHAPASHADSDASAGNSANDADAQPAAPKGRTLGFVTSQSGDTLGKIASRLAKPGRAGALGNALFARNPQAFSSETPDSLLAHARLSVPSSAKNLLSDEGLEAIGAAASGSASAAAPASSASADASLSTAGAPLKGSASVSRLRRQLEQKQKELASLKTQEARVSAQEAATQAQIDELQAKIAQATAPSDAAAGAAPGAQGSSAIPAPGAGVALGASAVATPAFPTPSLPGAKNANPASAAAAFPAPASSSKIDLGAPVAAFPAPASASASAIAAPASAALLPLPGALGSANSAGASSVAAAKAPPSAASVAGASGAVAASGALAASGASMVLGAPLAAPAGAAALGASAAHAKRPMAPVVVNTDVQPPPDSFFAAMWESPMGKGGIVGAVLLLLGYFGYKANQKRRDNAAFAAEEASGTGAAPEFKDSAPAALSGEEAAAGLNSFLGQDATTRGSAPQDHWDSVFEAFETQLRVGDDARADVILRDAEASSDPSVRARAAKARARLDSQA